ncbi:MAG: OmpA family protein [Chitinophagales bacterium]
MISRKLTLAVILLLGSVLMIQAQPAQNSFPPKPANQWYLGIHLGLPQIMGDIPSEPFGGQHAPAFGAGLNIRKGLGYVTSLRLHGMYAQAYGQDFIQGSFLFNKTLNGAFANNTNENYSTGADYTGNVWVPNYKATLIHGSLDLMFNLNNVNFHNPHPKFLVYAYLGVGGMMYNTAYDAIDASGNEYDFSTILSQFGSQNTSEQDRIDAIHQVLDGDYETQAEVANPASRSAGEVRATYVRNPSLSGGMGVSWMIGNAMEIGLEHRATHYFDDLADGQRWQFNGSYTAHYDLFQYTNLTVGINLGKDKVDPLWEVNPLAYVYDKLAELDPDEMLKDSDNDGVIDRLDKEPNTPEGTPVDTHGVSLDSDKDGCPDSEDPEPFSSPVLPMENCQNVHVTMKQVEDYVDERLKDYRPSSGGEWYLPMIFFDLNKYNIRPDAVPTLEYVAEIMTKYPKLTIEVVGHTDTRAGEDYNMKLSENRAKAAINYLVSKGVKEDQMKLVYKGESEELIQNAKSEEEHSMNRRVEFHIIKTN